MVERTNVFVEQIKYDMLLEKYQRSENIIMQLWYCLDKGYTHEEAKIHIKAWLNGQSTVKKSVVEVVNKEDK